MNVLKDYVFSKLKYGLFFKKRLNQIKEYHNLPPNNLLDLENKKLLKIIFNAYNNSSFYRNLYDEFGVNMNQIQNKSDLVKLPILKKEQIKNSVDDIYIGNKIKYTSYTSGTSGTPLKVYYGIDCVLNEASYNEIFRNNAGHFFGDRVISLRGALDGNQMEHYDKFNKILYLSSYHLTPENAQWYYNKIIKFSPKSILGYPSALESLSMIFTQKKLNVHIPLSFTSSESLYEHQQEKIEKVLGTKIFDRYGNAERTISLIQHSTKGPYHSPSLYSINEFQDSKSIITTSLINPSFPLIRYEVNDSIEVSNNNTIDRIGGRVDDFLTTTDGLRIGSAAMSLAFKKVSNVLFSQIIQYKLNEISVNIVVNDKFTDTNKHQLLQEIRQRIGPNMLLHVNQVTEKDIVKTKANKYKLIINKI